jgi:hypothetical protein
MVSNRELARRLSQASREAWNSEEGQRIREELSADTASYAACLRRVMESGGGSRGYKDCARRSGIGMAFASVWGSSKAYGRPMVEVMAR